MPILGDGREYHWNDDYEEWTWGSEDNPGDEMEDPGAYVPGFDSYAECNCPGCCASRVDGSEPGHRPESEHYEETDDGIVASAEPPLALVLESIPDRPNRRVSFEQEIGGNARSVATLLYEAGLTSEPRVWDYHSGNSEWLHVERDGSVDGEIIFSRLHLDNPSTARRAESALHVVQSALTSGVARLDSRCGFHVHVGIGYDDVSGSPCYGMGAVESLYHLWNHVEDVVFRLASANWARHRTDRGNTYGGATRKGLTGAVGIGQRLQRDRLALNLQGFLASRASCSCGAFQFGDWAACTCPSTPKPTVEFRVFNATANTRKVRAYCALALALVAYAERHACTPDSHPVNEWRGSARLDEATAAPVLRFILRDLPLTDAEREDLRYCAFHSMRGEQGSLRPIVAGIRRRKGHDRAAVRAVQGR